jgi:hypothetical protein
MCKNMIPHTSLESILIITSGISITIVMEVMIISIDVVKHKDY